MFRFRFVLPLLILTLILIATAGCVPKNSASPAQALDAMLGTESPLPAGRIYSLSPAKTAEVPSDSLLAALFGSSSSLPPAMDSVEDAAFFLAYSAPFEMAVFLCASTSDTAGVSRMCTKRLEALKSTYTTSDSAESIPALENARIVVRGRWVILCVCEDPEAALRAFRRTASSVF